MGGMIYGAYGALLQRACCFFIRKIQYIPFWNSSGEQILSDNRHALIHNNKRMLAENVFDIVIINAPLPDEFGTELALDVCEGSGTGVLLLVKAEHYADIHSRVSQYGVLVISKPTNSQAVSQSLRERLRRMEQKTASIEEKMEEIRIVNRAKCLLIEQLKMTEKEAHRYIEKQAMDRCVTRRTIAENIISTYK